MQLPEFKRDIVSIIANRLQEKRNFLRLLLRIGFKGPDSEGVFIDHPNLVGCLERDLFNWKERKDRKL